MTPMAPVEAAFVDPVFGHSVLLFDGAVLERFAIGATGQSTRFHHSMITVTVKGPNRKGYLELDVGLRGEPGGFTAHFDAQYAPAVEPIFVALRAAGVPMVRQP